MEPNRISLFGTLCCRLESLTDGGRFVFLLLLDISGVHRPGDHRFPPVFETQEIFHTIGFGFEFQNGVGLPGKELHQNRAIACQPVQRQDLLLLNVSTVYV